MRTVEENNVGDEALEVKVPAEIGAPDLHDQNVQQHVLVSIRARDLVSSIVEDHEELPVALKAAHIRAGSQNLRWQTCCMSAITLPSSVAHAIGPLQPS